MKHLRNTSIGSPSFEYPKALDGSKGKPLKRVQRFERSNDARVSLDFNSIKSMEKKKSMKKLRKAVSIERIADPH